MKTNSIPRNPLAFTWWATAGDRRLMVVCWVAVFCAIAVGRTEFVAISKLIDSANLYLSGETLDNVWFWALTLVVLGLFTTGLWRVSGFSGQKWMTAATARVYDTLFQYLTGHSTNYFQNRFAGAITNKISNAAQGVIGLLQITTWQFFPLLLGLVGDTYLLYHVHPHLAWILLGWLIVFFAVDLGLVVKLRKLAYAHAEASSKLKGKLVDSASNIDTVHHQAEELYEHRYVGDFIHKEKNAHRKSWFLFEWILIANGILLSLLSLGLFSLCIFYFEQGVITVGALAMIVSIVFNLDRNLFFLGEQLSRAMQLYGQIDEGLEELLQPHEITVPSGADALALKKGRVVLDRVNFSYGNAPVFTDLSIDIPGGQRVGLVGPSGAGKSTLVNLLLRQYDIQSGSISIDGQNISEVTLSSLRKQIALVPQSTTLFHRTIAENIRYGRLDANEQELMHAAHMAQADEFIKLLPEGYETYVGERGVKLSGGQRQRISIARALLKDSPILILDEATSALDSESEEAIQHALEKLMEGRTVIAIAHRLSTLRQMDRILVMQEGRLIEDGHHNELLEQDGLYARLWNSQVGGFLSEEAA